MMKRLLLLSFVMFQVTVFAQYSVKVGTENSGSTGFEPANNQYDYGWCATVYTQDDIGSHGEITRLYYKTWLFGAFGPGANTYMMNQRIFMKQVTDDAMTSDNFPDTTQMTLVYAGIVNFLNYELAEITLDVPFTLDPGKNLMILYVNMNGNAETDQDHFLIFTTEHGATTNNTVYNNGNGSFPGSAGTYTSDMPVVYLRYSPGLDAGISAINQGVAFKLPQQGDLSCDLHNYMADTITNTNINWSFNDVPQTPVNWSGNSYCGQDLEVTLQTDVTFAPGAYKVKAFTSNPNGGVDELNDNDTSEITITVDDNKTIAAWNYTDNAIPFLSNRGYGWSSSIYNKDSIAFSGRIQAIAYYVTNTNGNTKSEPNQKIFMRMNDYLTHPSASYPDTNQFTKVFEGTIDFSSVGWHVITLDTVFDYDNAHNLQVLYENRAGEGTVQATDFKVGWTGTNAIYNYDLNTFPEDAGYYSNQSRVPALRIFFSIPKDAGVIALEGNDNPRFVGSNEFVVDLKNFGLETIQNLDVRYQVDQGTAQTTHWSGTMEPLVEITNLHIGSENLGYGDHIVKIWTENPDYLPDYANGNDTLQVSLRACTPMAGNYTVGDATSDFLTVKAAMDSLNNCGIYGPVTFDIKPGTYKAQYLLNAISGASSTNTITFRSASGDSTDVVLTTDSTDYLCYLNGADDVTFSSLTFASDSALQLVVLDSSACNVTVSHCVFTGTDPSATGISSQDFNNENLSVSYSTINTGTTGISVMGNTENILNTTVENNVFENQTIYTLRFEKSESFRILGNRIAAKKEAIHLYQCDDFSIEKNIITVDQANKPFNFLSCVGSADAPNLIANNFISGTLDNLTLNPVFKLSGVDYLNIYNNSINSASNNSTVIFYTFSVNHINIVNNIVDGGEAMMYYLGGSTVTSDYNSYYTTGALFAQNGSNISTLNDWQVATGQDAHALFGFTNFNSDSDLHTQAWLVDNNGTPLPEVTTDIDGEMRDATTPDIGADEFDSPCTGPLSGTYTIGTAGDYHSFMEAVDALYNCGVSGPVVFEAEAGTYTEQVAVDGYSIPYARVNGDPFSYPVTFTSASGDSTDVVIQYDAATDNNYVLKLENLTAATFSGMTFQALNPSFGRIVELGNNLDTLLFSHCRFVGVTPTTPTGNAASCIYAADYTDTDTADISFVGNVVTDGDHGIYIDYGNDKPVRCNVEGNNFSGQTGKAIHYYQVLSSLIEDNLFDEPVATHVIEAYIHDTCTLSGNRVIHLNPSGVYGIIIYGKSRLINNFIVDRGQIAVFPYGDGTLLYNTIVTDGQAAASSVSVRLFQGTDTLYNNCIVNLAGGRVFANEYVTLTSDYNNLYTTGDFSNSPMLTFEEWQTTSGGDAHSVSFSPAFESGTDLHTRAVLLNGKGLAQTSVVVDIDGEMRDPSTPDIGADEFDNPVFTAGEDTVFCFYSDKWGNAESHIYDIGQGYDSYLWSNGSDSSSIAFDTTSTLPGEQDYIVTVTTGGNSYTDTVHIWYDLPVAIDQTEYCYWNTPVTVTANPGFEYYDWGAGDDTIAYLTVNYPYSSYLTVTDKQGCFSKQETVHINGANDNYPANINLEDTVKLCANHTMQLDGNQYSGTDVYGIYSYLWNTGDTTQNLALDGSSLTTGDYAYEVTITLDDNALCVSHDTVVVKVDPCTGTGELTENKLSVFPNPASGSVFIKFGTPVHHLEVALYNILGKLVTSTGEEGPVPLQKEISLAGVPKGIYFLRVKADNEVYQEKLVVR